MYLIWLTVMCFMIYKIVKVEKYEPKAAKVQIKAMNEALDYMRNDFNKRT